MRIYGKTVTLKVKSFDVWWPKSGVKIRVVITRHPKVRKRICYMSSTDLGMSPAEIIHAFSMRWSIEQMFSDAKLEIGLDTAEVRTANSVCRHAALAFGFVTIVRLWSLRKSAGRKNPPASLRRQLAALREDTIMQTLFSSIPGSGRSRRKVAEVAKLVATRT
ncbi:MAG: hypothetical protein JXA57_09850 [Armatimonadetes bacterium]|nr:hypothetical protein [Armatimonadota bacterium]